MSIPPKVMIVEDDTEISRLTKMLLETEGYECKAIFDGVGAVAEIQRMNPDIVILDVMLPGLTGVEVCSQIRVFYQGAILMLTGCDDDITELASFKQGADDYVTKPIKPHLLLARIQALLKRTQHKDVKKDTVLLFGDLHIDCQNRNVQINGNSLDLTSAEFDILEVLAKQAGEVVSREQCCEQLRGFEYDGMDRSIDMRISSLRKKMDVFPGQEKRIITVRGRGYMLVTQ
ncbi:MAG: response regulator transcription factor [Pseudomonadales bacterium]|nr:response regulator transcription factor [Pseudomonadales bacterium]